jgi:hypothetical protein
LQYILFNRAFEQSYVGGVSLTHGAPGEREHIWTFAAGYDEEDILGNPGILCPCATSDPTVTSPPFVGDEIQTAVHFKHSLGVTLYGMVVGVAPTVPAASSTTLHGSPKPYTPPQLMT